MGTNDFARWITLRCVTSDFLTVQENRGLNRLKVTGHQAI